MVAATVVLTGYGQLVLKWQASARPPAFLGFAAHWPPVVQMLVRPWVLSALLAAFAASVCWMLALTRLELSRAYPFTAATLVLVSLAAVPIFGESLGPVKVAGLALVAIGLIVISQG